MVVIMTTRRYVLLTETSDTATLLTALALFTNVHAAPAREQSHLTELTFDATDDALDAYLDAFALPRSERDDIFCPLDVADYRD